MGKKKVKTEYNDFTEDTRYTAPVATNPTPQPPKPPTPKGTHPTHFLALPLVTPLNRARLAAALDAFRDDVRAAGVDARAVRPLGSLHLTLGVMRLETEGEVEGVGAFLGGLDFGALLGGGSKDGGVETQLDREEEGKEGCGKEEAAGLTINLTGLHPMQTPSRTSVLYALPRDENGRFSAFCNALRDEFVKAGWLLDEARDLRLHVTLANTIYAKPRGTRGKSRAGARGSALRDDGEVRAESDAQSHSSVDNKRDGGKANWRYFDASGLIEQYAEFIWAERVPVDRVQVCRMGAGSDGVYVAVAERGV